MNHYWLSIAALLAGSSLAQASHHWSGSHLRHRQLHRRDVPTVDPNTVKLETRQSWCNTQLATCGTLCGTQGLSINSCDHNTLDYDCTCLNGTAPGLDYYTDTMPTLICEYAYNECSDAAADDTGRGNCKTDIESECGTLDPSTAIYGDSSRPSSASAATATGGSNSTAMATGGETKTTASATNSGTGLTTGQPNPGSSSGDDGGLSAGAKAGVGIAATAVGLFALAGIAFAFYKFHGARKNGRGEMMDRPAISGPFEKVPSTARSTHSGWSGYELDAKPSPFEMGSASSGPQFVAGLPGSELSTEPEGFKSTRYSGVDPNYPPPETGPRKLL